MIPQYLMAVAMVLYGAGMVRAGFHEPTFMPQFFRIPALVAAMGEGPSRAFRVLFGVGSIGVGCYLAYYLATMPAPVVPAYTG